MTHAYDESYLNDAMRNLAEAVDYAANSCKLQMDEFMNMFVACGLAEQFGTAVPRVTAGMSGTELVWETLRLSGVMTDLPEPQMEYECSPEYWCGWVLAYYQWYTGRSYKNILQHITMEEVRQLYSPLHEAGEDHFVYTINQRIRAEAYVTRLQQQRKAVGYSQRVLAEKSGVNLRTLQQYESGDKDINKAAVTTLLLLSRTLGCRMEDLLEYRAEND